MFLFLSGYHDPSSHGFKLNALYVRAGHGKEIGFGEVIRVTTTFFVFGIRRHFSLSIYDAQIWTRGKGVRYADLQKLGHGYGYDIR